MIGVLGISYKTAAQDIRERFVFTKDEIICFGEIVQQNSDASELVIVSTCNRTEIYFYHDKSHNQKIAKKILDLLAAYKKVDNIDEDHFYKHYGLEAVKHLFRVTSGIDSMVIGEDQIVGQVKEAYIHCTEAALTDAVLMRLFQKSFEAAKRTRSETQIQQGPTSISYAAVDLCAKIFNDLSEKSVLFIGSGETGSLALQNMKKRGVTKTLIANRTFENAVSLAKEFDAQAIEFEKIDHYLPQSDIVIVATGAQNLLITKKNLEKIAPSNRNNPQIFIDLSVPRNIEKSIENLPNVQLYGVDDIQIVLNNTVEKRKASIHEANIIIEEVAEEYLEWFETRTLKPLIKTLMNNMQSVYTKEVAALKKGASNKTPETPEEFGNRLTQKYIGLFIKNLKEIRKNNSSAQSLHIINELFTFEKK